MKDIDGIEAVLKVLKPHWREVEADFDRHNRRFLELAASDHDSIGRVLRAHMVVESFLNTFLPAHYGFENFSQIKLSFYQKAMLLPITRSSAAFVRPGILQLNAVRNKFGHRLDHEIAGAEVGAIYEILRVARKDRKFKSPVDAIEAFAPVACAFLSVPPRHLQLLFMRAFADVRTYTPEGVLSEASTE